MIERSQGMYRARRLDQRRSSYDFVFGLVACFAVVGWLWFLFASGFWNIETIETGELTSLNRGEVLIEVERILGERGWRPWSKMNSIMLDELKLATALKERIFVDEVAVDKSYPNILRLKIKERQRSVVLVTGEQYVNVDANGVVTGFVEAENYKAAYERIAARAFADEISLPVIVMPTADPLAPGFQAAKPEQVRRWLDTFKMMVGTGIKVRFMKIEAPESSLARFVSERGYDLYLDLSVPLETQINTYLGFMRSKPDESQIKEYLDVRVPGKVFVR